jgi:hypothetical protein
MITIEVQRAPQRRWGSCVAAQIQPSSP